MTWFDYFLAFRDDGSFKDEWVRVRRTDPCQVCHRYEHGCMNHVKNDRSLCANTESDRPRKTTPPTWLHYHHGAPTISRFTPVDDEPVFRADVATHDRVYSWMLAQFPLSTRDRKMLQNAGLKDLSDFGTLTRTEYSVVKLPFEITGAVPGVFKSRYRDEYYLKTSVTGCFSLVRNHAGKAVGVEIRLDSRSKKKSGTDAKYQPLTSVGKPGGISADTLEYGVVYGADRTTIAITEGRKKAQVLSEKTGYTVLFVRGVGSWRYIPAHLPRYFPQAQRIVDFYDMDRMTNKKVGMQRDALLEEIGKSGPYAIYTATWDEKHKGIDDAILAGLPWTETELKSQRNLLKLAESHLIVAAKSKEIMRKGRPGLELVEVTVGGGKSHSFIQEVNRAHTEKDWFQFDGRDARLLWLVDDNYELLEETERKFTVKPARLEGRNNDEGSPFYCANKGEVDLAAAGHHNIMKSVCIKCPIIDHCSYINKTQSVMRAERFVLAVKSSFLNASNRVDQFDIIVVDESLTNHLFETRSIRRKDLELHLAILAEAKGHPDLQAPGYEESIRVYEQVINQLLITLELNAGCRDEVELVLTRPTVKPRYLYNKAFSELVLAQFGYPIEFLDALMEESTLVHVYNDEILLDRPRRELMDKLRGKLVINLDATPSHHKLRLVGDYTHHRYAIEQHMNIFKLANMRGSKRQLDNDLTATRFLGAIEGIATRNRTHKTVCLSSKAFAKRLQAYSHRQDFLVDVGWYGNHTRGFNRFEDADNLILAGNFCRNLSFMRMQHRLLAKMGSMVTLEELVDEDSINEMVQAIGRGRATRREENPVNVFLLTNRDLPDLYQVTTIPSLESLSGLVNRDQQAGNHVRSADAHEKVRLYVQAMLEKGFSLTAIPRAMVSEKTGVSRATVKRSLQEMYYEQLEPLAASHCDKARLKAFADDLGPLTKGLARELGLEITSVTASVQDNYSLDALADVISEHADLAAYAKLHQPPAVQPTRWAAFLMALVAECRAASLTQSSVAAAAGLSRQVVAKYVQLLSPIVEAYLADFSQHDYASDEVDQWKQGSHLRTLTLFASQMAGLNPSDCQESGEEGNAEIRAMVTAVGQFAVARVDINAFARDMFEYGIGLQGDSDSFAASWKRLYQAYVRYVRYREKGACLSGVTTKSVT